MGSNNNNAVVSNARNDTVYGGHAEMREIRPLLPRLERDALAFFASFEKIMILSSVDQYFWARYLPAQLNERALKVYTRLSMEDSQDYVKIKDAILANLNLGVAEYQKMFRGSKRVGTCNYVTHLSNLRELQNRYLDAANVTTFDELKDLDLKEQFESSLSPNVRSFVCSREPKTAEESAKAADLYFQVTKLVTQNAQYSPKFGPQQNVTQFNPVRSGPAFNTNPRYGQNSQNQANRFVTQSSSGSQGGSGGQYRPNFNRGGNAYGQSRGNFNSAANQRFHKWAQDAEFAFW